MYPSTSLHSTMLQPPNSAYQHISDYTETLLPYPHPSGKPAEVIEQQMANRNCKALEEFWGTEEGQDWKAVIECEAREWFARLVQAKCGSRSPVISIEITESFVPCDLADHNLSVSAMQGDRLEIALGVDIDWDSLPTSTALVIDGKDAGLIAHPVAADRLPFRFFCNAKQKWYQGSLGSCDLIEGDRS
jgi:hypothetical protein